MLGETVTLYCEWCAEDRGRNDPGVVPLGRWAVVFRDCPGCLLREAATGSTQEIDDDSKILVPNILCTKHFSELVAQQLPDKCRECGSVRANFTEIIEQVIPLDPFAAAPPPGGDGPGENPPPHRTRFTVVDDEGENEHHRRWR